MDGTVVSGEGAGAGFVAAAEERLAPVVGFRPFPGTLNLAGLAGVATLPLRTIDESVGDERCTGVRLRPCTVGGIRGAVIRPLVPGYPEGRVELLAPVELRALFGLEDGDVVPVSPPDDFWWPDGPVARPERLESFDAMVFDLDGTLVDLAVDWPAVLDEIAQLLEPYLDRPLRELDRTEVFAAARAHGVYRELVDLVDARERRGADDAVALAGVRDLVDRSGPIGICTANARRTAEIALDRFDALDAVDAVVARETTREGKPHPQPLLACVDRLGVDPGNAVFVGDDPRDAAAASGAGTSFLHVRQLWPDR